MKLSGDPKTGTLGIRFSGREVRELDEVFIGNWLHLERMHGVKKRRWCLILTDEKGRVLNLSIGDNEGRVDGSGVYEDQGWGKR
jgi:hypothetical protein